MNVRSINTVRRATAMVAGVGALTGTFVLTPAMVAGTTAPAATPAAKPIKPSTTQVALGRETVKSVSAAGPSTTVPSKTYTNGSVRATSAVGTGSDAVVDVPASGDLVGITWPASVSAANHATVLVRVKTSSGWQEWHRVSADPSGNPKDPRIGTEPVWAPGAQRVQIRVAARDASLLRSATLSAVTSPGQASDAALRPTAVPGAASAAYVPTVISRAQWGADESMRRCPTEYSRTTRAVVVHHTADTNNYAAWDSARMLRSIYAYDTRTLGWCDMAYNVIVDKYGQIFEGRAGGLNRPVKAAHAYAFNNDTFGVSILGNYELVAVPWAGFNALAQAIAMRTDSFYLDSYSKVALTSTASGGTTRYPSGTTVTLSRINGHKDTSYTACPGKYLYPRLGELRDLVDGKLTYPGSPLFKKYIARGGAGALGPVSIGESTVWAGTRRTVFTSGRRVYSGATGTYLIGPGIDATWQRYGNRRIGNLVTDETSTTAGNFVRLDTGRYITWSRGTVGSHLVSGGILAFWKASGGPWANPYGMANGDITSNSAAWWQRFGKGHIYWTRSNQGYGTTGTIDSTYFGVGGPNGVLGLPTSNVSWTNGTARQNFVGGTITVDATGKATVRRR